MKAQTLLDSISSWLGTPLCAAPLSRCHIIRPHLLTRADIPTSGTALLLFIPYLVCEDASAAGRNLSLYAVPRDYHGYVKELGERLIPALQEAYPAHRFALFADHSPIAEVDAAARAGLGVLGDNGLLITPDYGSFGFIAEVCTDLDYAAVTGRAAEDFPDAPSKCEGCGACAYACPAKRHGEWTSPCLSALTQKKGDLSQSEAHLLSAHPLVWGCDTCQTVCPHNIRVLAERHDTPIDYFRADRKTQITLEALDSMTDADFERRAYAWRGRTVIHRNLLLKKEETP